MHAMAEIDLDSVIVPKEPLRVRLMLGNGELLEGEIFLAASAGREIERQLRHFLKELGDGFFPLRTGPGQDTQLLHTRALCWLAAPVDGFEPPLGEQRRVRVELTGGQRLEGLVILDVDVFRPRVSDLLNRFRQYLVLDGDFEMYLVNRDAIARVYDLGAAQRS